MSILAHHPPRSPDTAPIVALDRVEPLDDATLAGRIERAGDGKPCRRRDPEDYFPLVGAKVAKPGRPRFREEQERARELCAGCPVTAECLEFALRGFGPYGVWGAHSQWERTLIRSARIRARRGAATPGDQPASVEAAA